MGQATVLKYGSVYTPDLLADYVARLIWEELPALGDAANLKILDPACGELSLLRAMHRNKPAHLETEYIGIDVDAEAIENSTSTNFGARDEVSLHHTDFVLPGDEHEASWDYWARKLPAVDIVVSNPPWSSDRIYSSSMLLQQGYVLAEGQYDSYELFIESTMRLVKPGGVAAFIVPDSIFASSFVRLRKLLVSEYSLKVISRLGEKLFPDVNRATAVLVVHKAMPLASSEVSCFRLDTSGRASVLRGESTFWSEYTNAKHVVKQSRFANAKDVAFNIDAKFEEERLIEKIETLAVDSKEVFRFARGVEISKTGFLAQCSDCYRYQGVTRKQVAVQKKICTVCGADFEVSQEFHAISAEPKLGTEPVIVGEDIHRYNLETRNHLLMGLEGISYKDRAIYSSPKILIRKTGLGINAAIDSENTLVTQSVYILQPQFEDTELIWYYLALLNSRVTYYYYLKTYGENEWKSHPYLTKGIVFSLPLRDPKGISRELFDAIIMQAKEMQNSRSRSTDLALESLVARVYDLSVEDETLIREVLNALPNLKSVNGMKY